MPELNLDNLKPPVARRISPFFTEVLGTYGANIHSIHVVGSALTEDYREGTSDINSIFVLTEMDLKFLEVLAPRGKKYRKEQVAAPLIMTPEYITKSTDVFPMEFLSFRLLHDTVYGEDVLEGIEIRPSDLRHQCEREMKAKLIGLRQGYLSTMGSARDITDGIVASFAGFIPLFRGIIHLKGATPPPGHDDVLNALESATGVDCSVFRKVLAEKRKKAKLSKEEVDSLFEEYYAVTERLGKVVDEIQV
jgi:hypothetical protein